MERVFLAQITASHGAHMNFFSTLISWDYALFHFINTSLSNSLFDTLMPLCREKWIWAPLYLFIAAFSLLHFGQRGWIVIISLVAVTVLSDQLSSQLIKKNVRRLRPCNEPALVETVRLRIENCGSGFSFTSSHAANHFAVAILLLGIFGDRWRWVRPAAWGWATLIAFSQIYVGVHYPGDVLGGALVGIVIGWLIGQICRHWLVRNRQEMAGDF